MVQIACPQPDQFQQLLLGKLPPEQARVLARHVGDCPTCAKLVVALKTKLKLGQKPRSGGEGAPPALPGKARPPAQAELDSQDASDAPTVPPAAPAEAAQPTAAGSDAGAAADRPDYSFLAPAQAPDELGRLGGYRVLKVLGQGGMGIVFEAEDVQLQRAVALKAMLPEIARKADARERFLREARAAAKLNHDNVVTIHQVSEDRGVPFIAMPLLKGGSLEDYLRPREARVAGPALKLAQTLRIAREIARGLAAAHEQGLVHRDIKPANVWLDATAGSRVKILDFGLARVTEGEQTLTQSGAIVGTPAYMAPEQGQSQPVDGRTDLFSLGVVLYRLVTGQLPFKGRDTMSTLLAVVTHYPPAPATLNASLPKPVSDLVMKLLAKDPRQRPASAKDVVKSVQALEKDLAAGGGAELDMLPMVQTGPRVPPAAPAQRTPSRPAPPRTTQRIPQPERGGKKGILVLAVVLGLFIVLSGLGVAAYFLAVPYLNGEAAEGTLVFQRDDPTVALTIRQDGLLVKERALDREMGLKPGTYSIEPADANESVTIHPDVVTIAPGQRQTVHVRIEKLTAPTSAAPTIVQLLPLVDPKQDQLSGSWKINNEEALASDTEVARLQLPYRPPAEYDLRVRFRRLKGNDALMIYLVGGGRQFCFLLGGFANTVAGFEVVDGQRVKDNPTARYADKKLPWVRLAQRQELLFNVRKDRVHVFLDGVKINELVTNFQNLSVPQHQQLMKDSQALGLLTHNSPTAFEKIEVVEFGRAGEFLRPNDPAAKKARKPHQARPTVPEAIAADWVPLFNGHNLDGWSAAPEGGAGRWKVVKGAITCTGLQSYLYTNRDDYRNFRLRVEAKINPHGNSGVFFRAARGKPNPDGYEAQIDINTDKQKTGSLYNLQKVLDNRIAPNKWFTMEIEARGKHIEIFLNNDRVVSYTETGDKWASGHIALQHQSVKTTVFFRKIEIKKLPSAAAAR